MTHPAPGRLVPQDEAEYGSGKDEEPGARHHVPHPLHVQLPHLSASQSEKASQRHLLGLLSLIMYQSKQRGGNATPLPEPDSVKIWGAYWPTPPYPPTLLACCETEDSQPSPNHTICPRLYCCQLLRKVAGQPGTNFSQRGKEYTIRSKHTKCTHLAGLFLDKWQNHRPVPPIRKSPIPLLHFS
jgi:hypothetical protein